MLFELFWILIMYGSGADILAFKCYKYVLFCQPRVEVTSCFVYKVMGLTFYDRINTKLIY